MNSTYLKNKIKNEFIIILLIVGLSILLLLIHVIFEMSYEYCSCIKPIFKAVNLSIIILSIYYISRIHSAVDSKKIIITMYAHKWLKFMLAILTILSLVVFSFAKPTNRLDYIVEVKPNIIIDSLRSSNRDTSNDITNNYYDNKYYQLIDSQKSAQNLKVEILNNNKSSIDSLNSQLTLLNNTLIKNQNNQNNEQKNNSLLLESINKLSNRIDSLKNSSNNYKQFNFKSIFSNKVITDMSN